MKVLNALDALDRHSFERIDANNSLETLYAKIFPAPNTTTPTSSAKESPSSQEETRVQYVSYVFKLLVVLACLVNWE